MVRCAGEGSPPSWRCCSGSRVRLSLHYLRSLSCPSWASGFPFLRQELLLDNPICPFQLRIQVSDALIAHTLPPPKSQWKECHGPHRRCRNAFLLLGVEGEEHRVS